MGRLPQWFQRRCTRTDLQHWPLRKAFALSPRRTPSRWNAPNRPKRVDGMASGSRKDWVLEFNLVGYVPLREVCRDYELSAAGFELREFCDETLGQLFKIPNRRSRSSLVIAQGRAPLPGTRGEADSSPCASLRRRINNHSVRLMASQRVAVRR